MFLPLGRGSLSADNGAFESRPLKVTEGTSDETIRELGKEALDQLMTEFVKAAGITTSGPTRYAILPFPEDLDGDYFTLQADSHYTSIARPEGLELFVRDTAVWDDLLDEIEKGMLEGDTMDRSTIQQFGNIQGVEGIIRCKISSIDYDDDQNLVMRINMQAYEVETGQKVWAGEGKSVKAAPAPPTDHTPLIIMAVAALVGLIILFILVKIVGGAVRRASRPR